MVSEAALRGYLLEEVLAWLLRTSGYELLAAEDDVEALKMTSRGLAVRGRGAWHQADVLGEFRYVPPFSLPVRLFLEAKFHTARSGLSVVRNGHGVVNDVNENLTSVPLSPDDGRARRPRASYRYSYALFSTSGFSVNAQLYALAHQISLVDLSVPEFRELTVGVAEVARALYRTAPPPASPQSVSVRRVREYLRIQLGRDDDASLPVGMPAHVVEQLEGLAASLRRRSTFGLVLAFPAAPFVLGMVAENLRSMVRYCLESPTHEVHIRRAVRSGAHRTWAITPVSDPGAYRLTFGLPSQLEEWIADQGEGGRSRLRWTKENLLSAMTIYWLDGVHTHVFRLRYAPTSLRQG